MMNNGQNDEVSDIRRDTTFGRATACAMKN